MFLNVYYHNKFKKVYHSIYRVCVCKHLTCKGLKCICTLTFTPALEASNFFLKDNRSCELKARALFICKVIILLIMSSLIVSKLVSYTNVPSLATTRKPILFRCSVSRPDLQHRLGSLDIFLIMSCRYSRSIYWLPRINCELVLEISNPTAMSTVQSVKRSIKIINLIQVRCIRYRIFKLCPKIMFLQQCAL